MARLKPGDRIECRVKESVITNPYKEFDELMTLEIVSKDLSGCYVYVPPYLTLKNTFKLDSYKCKELEVDKRFLGVDCIYVATNLIYKISSQIDGMRCKKCEEFCHMAACNQSDGSFICWGCRNNPYR